MGTLAVETKPLHGIKRVFKKNLNAPKPSEHAPSGEKMSKGLGGNIGCRDKTSSWYQTGIIPRVQGEIQGTKAGRPGSSEVPRNPLTRWDVSSIPANVIFLTKKLKNTK